MYRFIFIWRFVEHVEQLVDPLAFKVVADEVHVDEVLADHSDEVHIEEAAAFADFPETKNGVIPDHSDAGVVTPSVNPGEVVFIFYLYYVLHFVHVPWIMSYD